MSSWISFKLRVFLCDPHIVWFKNVHQPSVYTKKIWDSPRPQSVTFSTSKKTKGVKVHCSHRRQCMKDKELPVNVVRALLSCDGSCCQISALSLPHQFWHRSGLYPITLYPITLYPIILMSLIDLPAEWSWWSLFRFQACACLSDTLLITSLWLQCRTWATRWRHIFTGSCGSWDGVLTACCICLRCRYRLDLGIRGRVSAEPSVSFNFILRHFGWYKCDPQGRRVSVPCRSLTLTSADAAFVFTLFGAGASYRRGWKSRKRDGAAEKNTQTFHFLPCQSVKSASTNFWRFTFVTLVSPLHQQSWQRTHMRIALTGADIAGSARAHGTHVVHRCLNNWSQGSPGATVGAIFCSRLGRRGLGVWFLGGAAEREVGEASKPLETLRGEQKEAERIIMWQENYDVDPCGGTSVCLVCLLLAFLYSLCLLILMPKLFWIFKTITIIHEYGVQFVFQNSHLPLFFIKRYFFQQLENTKKVKRVSIGLIILLCVC